MAADGGNNGHTESHPSCHLRNFGSGEALLGPPWDPWTRFKVWISQEHWGGAGSVTAEETEVTHGVEEKVQTNLSLKSLSAHSI